MNNFFTSLYPVINLHKKMSIKAEIVTQMIYGESFSILKSNNKWLKIKILEDNYKGFIKRRDFAPYIKSTHKVYSLKANIYKFPNNKKKVSELTFGSKIKIKAKKLGFFKFNKGWINQKEVKTASFKEKNIFKKISIFENIKYKWGGKTFKGIDCSALIQVFFNFNNKYCPRDVKDQIRYFKKNTQLKKIKKNNIIYWKGHVAIVLSKNKLIHAYGPMKKTIIMSIDKSIKIIRKTAGLKVIAIKKI